MWTDKRKPLTRQGNLELPTESTARGRASDMQGAPLALLPSVDQCRRGAQTAARQTYRIAVPVVGKEGEPLMPTTPSRARRWIKRREATPFFKHGIFCVRLNREPSSSEKQEIAVGIDPGSKKEGFTVKSESHTYLNIQADAVQHVKWAIEVRRNMRRSRRSRKTPCRADRQNRSRGCLSPSTKARWQWKLRVARQLLKVFPITDFVVEDIKAKTTGQRRWDASFSPLEVGKEWFYSELRHLGTVHLKQGWETKELRDTSGLEKSKSKLAEIFEAHCVDSWVLANWRVGGHTVPDNKTMLCISPIRLHRRQLHMLQFSKGGLRKLYGGTRSCGFKRGALAEHPKYGTVYIGGTMSGRVSLLSMVDGKRLCQNAKPSEIKIKTYNAWRTRFLSSLKGEVSARGTR
jgi:hypothetical protein